MCHLTSLSTTEIPVNEYYEYFGPDHELDVKASNTEDMNTPQYLERVKNLVLENLRYVGGPPSVQMSGENLFKCRSRIPVHKHHCLDIPSLPIDDIIEDPNKDEDLIPPNERRPMRLLDSRRQGDGELSDSDDEGEGGRRNHASNRDREESPSGSASATRDADEDDGGGRKFGMGGVGIMSSGQAASTHGAGPSGHTTIPPIMAKPASGPGSPDSSAAMEVDEGGTDSAPAIPTPAKERSAEPEKVVNGMAIDPPANPPLAATEAS